MAFILYFLTYFFCLYYMRGLQEGKTGLTADCKQNTENDDTNTEQKKG